MARIISFANAKGGTGKTTCAVNLAACMAQNGKRVLGIDLDAQGNFGIAYGLDPRAIERTAFHLLCTENPDLRDYVIEVRPNLSLIPNAISARLENQIESARNRDGLLKQRLRQVKRSYDYILIDTPPAMRTPTMNAIVASDEIVVVVDCGFFALYGLDDLMREIAAARDAYDHHDITIRGLLNLFNKTQVMDREIKREVSKFFGELMCETTIHKNIKLPEAQLARQPIIEYDRTASGAFDFFKLTKELLAEYEPEEEATDRLARRDPRKS